jgi:hypothetical protein
MHSQFEVEGVLEEVVVILDPTKRKKRSFDFSPFHKYVAVILCALILSEVFDTTAYTSVETLSAVPPIPSQPVVPTTVNACLDDEAMIAFSFFFYPLVFLADIIILALNIIVFCLGTGNNYWVFVPLSNNGCGWGYNIIFLVIWAAVIVVTFILHVLISVYLRPDWCSHISWGMGFLAYFILFATLKAALFDDFGPIIWVALTSIVSFFFYTHPCPNCYAAVEDYFRSLKCWCCRSEDQLPTESV